MIAEISTLWRPVRSLVVGSVVHVLDSSHPVGGIFLESLKSLQGRSIPTLVLLGDIFDFCFGDSHYFKEKFRVFGEILTQLSSEGTRVIGRRQDGWRRDI